jgi:hypothetical protein
MKSKAYFPKHVVWSDECVSQFKSAQVWYFLAQYPQVTICEEKLEGVEMIWNYFASGHGKGEVDGASVLLKCEICKEQIKPQA